MNVRGEGFGMLLLCSVMLVGKTGCMYGKYLYEEKSSLYLTPLL